MNTPADRTKTRFDTILWWALRLVVVLLAGLSAMAVARNIADHPRTDDAEVRANTLGVAPQVGGTIVRIFVADNEFVEAGQPLLELDARPYLAEAERARAQLEVIRLEVAARAEAIAEAEAAVARQEALASYARTHYERMLPLLEKEFFSADRVERAKTDADSAAAELDARRAALTRARFELAQDGEINWRVAEAEASLRDAELRASFCLVAAPVSGIVTNLQISPGAYAAAGEQIFTLVDNSTWFVLAFFRESELVRIMPGQQCRVFLMSSSGEAFPGIVEGIAAGVAPLRGASRGLAGGEGVLEEVAPTFDFIQLATRVPVRIRMEDAPTDLLRTGGRAAVVIDSLHSPIAP